MGLLNMRLPLPAPLRFLQTGPVWSISTALLVYLAEYGPENMWEFVEVTFWDDLPCLLVTILASPSSSWAAGMIREPPSAKSNNR